MLIMAAQQLRHLLYLECSTKISSTFKHQRQTRANTVLSQDHLPVWGKVHRRVTVNVHGYYKWIWCQHHCCVQPTGPAETSTASSSAMLSMSADPPRTNAGHRLWASFLPMLYPVCHGPRVNYWQEYHVMCWPTIPFYRDGAYRCPVDSESFEKSEVLHN